MGPISVCFCASARVCACVEGVHNLLSRGKELPLHNPEPPFTFPPPFFAPFFFRGEGWGGNGVSCTYCVLSCTREVITTSVLQECHWFALVWVPTGICHVVKLVLTCSCLGFTGVTRKICGQFLCDTTG
jgi:hypothetical protein